MRGCLTSLFAIPALILLAAWLVLPGFAGAIVTAGLGVLGFNGSDEQVGVTADPPIELLALHADRIRIRASNASFHGLAMDSVDVSLGDVALFDRSARSVSGTLTGVRFTPALGPTVAISSVALSGSGQNVNATLTLSAADLRALAIAAVHADAGVTPTRVTFAAPDRVTLVVGVTTVTGRLVVDEGGGLVLKPTAAAAGVVGQVDLIRPGPGAPFRLRALTLTSTGANITGTLDPAIFAG